MAKVALTDATVLYGGYDISGLTNVIGGLAVTVDEMESTVFTSNGWKEFIGVLKAANWSFEGLHDDSTSNPHAAMFTGADTPVLCSKTNPIAASDVAFMLDTLRVSYEEPSELGALRKWSISFTGKEAMSRGVCLDKQVATGSSQGTAIQHGAVATGQKLYAALFVLADNTLTSLDVFIESDATDGWVGSETTRATFAQVTAAPASERITVAGPITDDWWRIDWTLVGTSATFVVFIGIQ